MLLFPLNEFVLFILSVSVKFHIGETPTRSISFIRKTYHRIPVKSFVSFGCQFKRMFSLTLDTDYDDICSNKRINEHTFRVRNFAPIYGDNDEESKNPRSTNISFL